MAIQQVNPDYTKALGIALVEGRLFTESEADGRQHLAFVNQAMTNEYFFNADGEMLIVAQLGRLRFQTEFGVIDIAPGEICVIGRGIVFRVVPLDDQARAYVCKNYGAAFTLPDRGPIGANCLANARDFLTPVATYEDKGSARSM